MLSFIIVASQDTGATSINCQQRKSPLSDSLMTMVCSTKLLLWEMTSYTDEMFSFRLRDALPKDCFCDRQKH